MRPEVWRWGCVEVVCWPLPSQDRCWGASPNMVSSTPHPEIKLDASVFSSEKRLTSDKAGTTGHDSAPVTFSKELTDVHGGGGGVCMWGEGRQVWVGQGLGGVLVPKSDLACCKGPQPLVFCIETGRRACECLVGEGGKGGGATGTTGLRWGQERRR